MELALDIYQSIRDFLERGGDLLVVIVTVVFVMWALILDRLIYLSAEHPAEVGRALSIWRVRRDPSSWHSDQVYHAMLSRLAIRLQANIPLIKTLAALCPLLGLMGTVTGMIVIFDAVSVVGSGSARALASGVSMAIVTTMAGLVGALSGIFPAAILARTARHRMLSLRIDRRSVEAPVAGAISRLPRATRHVLAPVGSALITLSLILVMEQMILTGKEALTGFTKRYPAEFIRVERAQEIQQRERKPDRPPEPEEIPQWAPEALTADSLAQGNAMAIAAPQLAVDTEALQGVRGFFGLVSDGDYLPVLKVAPIYPRRAEERHLEGWVLLQFSLTTSGSVKDVEVLESSDPIFEDTAVAAVAKFKYKPRVVNGEAVEVEGVINRIVFDLPDQ